MKKTFSILSFLLVIAMGAMLMSYTFQKGNGKKEKEPQSGRGNGNQKPKDNKNMGANPGQDKPGKGNGNANASHGNGQGNNEKEQHGNNKIKGNGKGNGNDDRVNTNPGNSENRHGKIKNIGGENWYHWTNENFRDRAKFRNKEKVNICHKFSSNEEPVNISVSENAVKAHLGHGDVVGVCPPVNNSVFSDIFVKRRSNYYNQLYYGQDQYNYSNSVLDYALMRLASSRSQLDVMRANNAAAADIERRQASVVQLEENVSLLETVLGVAGQLLAERLQ